MQPRNPSHYGQLRRGYPRASQADKSHAAHLGRPSRSRVLARERRLPRREKRVPQNSVVVLYVHENPASFVLDHIEVNTVNGRQEQNEGEKHSRFDNPFSLRYIKHVAC